MNYIKRTAVVLCVGLLWPSGPIASQNAPVDFISIIRSLPDSGKSIGLHKLSASERAALNAMMNRVHDIGRNGSATAVDHGNSTVPSAPTRRVSSSVYMTRVESDDEDILRLENGAIVEITSGYLGYVGYRKRSALLISSSSCRVWIEGKRLFRCTIVRRPNTGLARTAVETSISDVRGNGSIIQTLDGVLYEVAGHMTFATTLWLPGANLLVLDDNEILNLDDSGEPVPVTRIR